MQYGWLVFGVSNKSKAIVGSDYRNTRGLETLKHEIAQNTTGGISFIDIFEVYDGENRVVMFKIPAAVDRLVISNPGDFLPGNIAKVLKPDYEYGDSRKVAVRVYGTTPDMNYTHILYDHPEYDLNTVFLLDQVQKRKEIGEADAKYLRSPELIDGRKPNLLISAKYDDVRKSSIGDVTNVTKSVTENIAEINETQGRMIELIQETPSVTLVKLAEAVGISERNIKTNIEMVLPFYKKRHIIISNLANGGVAYD